MRKLTLLLFIISFVGLAIADDKVPSHDDNGSAWETAIRLAPEYGLQIDPSLAPTFRAKYCGQESWRGDKVDIFCLDWKVPGQRAIVIVGPEDFEVSEVGDDEPIDHILLSFNARAGLDVFRRSLPGDDVSQYQGEGAVVFFYSRSQIKPKREARTQVELDEKGKHKYRRRERLVHSVLNTQVELSQLVQGGHAGNGPQNAPREYRFESHGRVDGGFATSNDGSAFCLLGSGKADFEFDVKEKTFQEGILTVGLLPAFCWARDGGSQPMVLVGPRADLRIGEHPDGHVTASSLGLDFLFVDRYWRVTAEVNRVQWGSDRDTLKALDFSSKVYRVLKKQWLVGAGIQGRVIHFENGATDVLPTFTVQGGWVFTGKSNPNLDPNREVH